MMSSLLFITLVANHLFEMKKIIFLLGLFASTQLLAQKDIVKFFPAGQTNTQRLVESYMSPVNHDAGALINSAWYNTGATHKKFGFDLTVSMSSIGAKSAEKTFVPSLTSDLSYDGATKGDKPPTAYGAEAVFPKFTYRPGSPNAGVTFQGPDGGVVKDAPVGSVLVPTLQAGVGLFANTDLRLRFTPAIKIGDNELSNWGIGVQHDIKQYFPGIKELPFGLSLFVGYSQLKMTTDLSGKYSGSGQKAEGNTNAYTAQVLVSKKLAIFTFYAGLGYNASKTDYAIKGTYNVNQTEAGLPLLSPIQLTNPVSTTTKTNGVRATGGIRFNFGPVILNGDYTFVNSKGLLSVGFGFTVR